MGLRILYGRVNIDPGPDDLYDIPDLGAPVYGRLREGIKMVLNAMIFSKKPLSRMPKGTRQLFPKGATIGSITSAIENRHPAIRHLFYKGIGHRDQFTESQIMVDLLLRLMDEGVVALQLHNAVLVAESKARKTEVVMLETFMTHVGIAGKVTRE